MDIDDLIDRPIDLMSVSFLRIKHLFHYILNRFFVKASNLYSVSNWLIFDSKSLRMVVMLDDRRQFSSWTTFWWCPVLDAYNKVKNYIKPTKEICDNHRRDSVVEQWRRSESKFICN